MLLRASWSHGRYDPRDFSHGGVARRYMATLGQMAVAAAAISAVAAPASASSLSLSGSVGHIQWNNGFSTGLLAGELPKLSVGEDAPQGVGSPSAVGNSKPFGTDEKWRTTSERMPFTRPQPLIASGLSIFQILRPKRTRLTKATT